MGIYSPKSTVSVDLGDGVVECHYENMHEAALNIIAESQYNYGEIMKQIGISELQAYEESGEEMVYESGNVEGFFSKIKAFFVSIWEKIKGLFKKFMAMLDVYAKTDKEFVAKYKKDLYKLNTNLKDFKYHGFVFGTPSKTLDAAVTAVDGVINTKVCAAGAVTDSASTEKIKTAKENSDDIFEEMRGAVAGGGSQTAAEFHKELFMMFRSGEETKQELENPILNEMVELLEGSAKLKTDAERAMKTLKKEIDDLIKQADKDRDALIKKMPNGDKGGSVNGGTATASDSNKLSNVIGHTIFVREKLAILQSYNGAHLTALKDSGRQAKAVCAALLSYKPTKEGTDVTLESGFLSNVKFK